ncbi:MAG TPA: DUF4124 domain-containing protein [Thermodesulfobacteriota bacterium]|nr:DUF4124 domain-containing protein [Thermodesulfobacteriota bacterium]
MRDIFIFLILLLFPISASAENVYKWVDKEGVVSFTDDYNRISPPYRDKAEVREYLSEGGTPLHLQEITPGAAREKEEAKADIYGREAKGQVEWEKKERKERGELKVDVFGQDKSYWKARVQPWKDRLNEATLNYDNAHRQFMEKAMELSEMRYGSRTQYKMKIIELDQSKNEMMTYQAKMVEVEEMLRRISKEAEEAKADPDWLE